MDNETKQSTKRSEAVARLYAFTLKDALTAARRDDKEAQARVFAVITAAGLVWQAHVI
jgi:hypothetical protein